MFRSSLAKVAGGFLLGTVGVSIMKSKLVTKSYKYLVAGAFIAKDSCVDLFEKTQAGFGDIAADAREITEKYYQSLDEEFEETAEPAAPQTEEA